MKKRKKRSANKIVQWDLQLATPDSAIYDFVCRKVNINRDDDIIKWATPRKEMRDAYKLYFKTFSRLCPDTRFVCVSEFNKLLKDLGLKQSSKHLTILDSATKKYFTKRYECWVGCRLLG